MKEFKVTLYEDDGSGYYAGLTEGDDITIIAIIPKHWPGLEARVAKLEEIAALANEARQAREAVQP